MTYSTPPIHGASRRGAHQSLRLPSRSGAIKSGASKVADRHPRVGRPEGERVANSAWVLINRPGCLLSSNAFEVLQAAIGGVRFPHPDYDDVDDEQPNHQRQHAREPVIQEQREHDKWRHDRRRSPDGVADAVGAKSHLSREQLRRVNSEQDRDLDVDRDDQQEANREQALPPGIGKVCSHILWRETFYKASINDTPGAKQKAFVRAVLKLQEAKLIGVWSDKVWLGGRGERPLPVDTPGKRPLIG